MRTEFHDEATLCEICVLTRRLLVRHRLRVNQCQPRNWRKAAALSDVSVGVELNFVQGKQAVLVLGEFCSFVIHDQVRPVTQNQNPVRRPAQDDRSLGIKNKEFGKVGRNNIALDVPETGQPRRRSPVTVKPAMDEPLTIGVNGAEYAGKDLVRKLVPDVHLDPETTRAEIGQRQRAKILGGNSDLIHDSRPSLQEAYLHPTTECARARREPLRKERAGVARLTDWGS